MNPIEQVQDAFSTFLREYFSIQDTITQRCTIGINTDTKKPEFGDINSNAPLILAKQLKRQPLELAQEISEHFFHDYIATVEAAKPGFVNITLTQDAFNHLAQQVYNKKSTFFTTPAETPTQYNLEFISTNPTGPLHFGHGRGGIIGDTLARILTFNSHNPTKEYYINDAGQQMEKLGMSVYYRCRQQLGDAISLPEDGYHGDYITDIAQKLIQEHGKAVVNNTYRFFARYASDRLLSSIKDTLDTYRITYDVWFSETKLHEDGSIDAVLNTLTEAGHLYHEDGTVWFASSRFGDDKDRVVQRSNGEYTYLAADIAYLHNKFKRGFDKLVMVLGQDHHGYVSRLKAATQALGYDADRLTIILYQLVTLKQTGQQVRMSKRTGNIVTLGDIIDMVGVDMARYFYLNKKNDAHLEFDLDLARTQSEENPVFYIQYAYVRTKSVLDKAYNKHNYDHISENDSQYVTEQERGILKKVAALKPLLVQIANNYQTHLLAHYVYDLAHTFHSYYGAHKIIVDDDMETTRGRLFLVHIVRNTLAVGLDLLGLDKPEHM